MAQEETKEALYMVETLVGNDWENLFNEGDEKMYFSSQEAAQAAIDEFLEETQEEFEAGNLDDPYDPDDYRVTKINEPENYFRAAKKIF